ncbi:unnamed protein product [Symbiodinium necroappetens]|uniref:Uncharacterized protein n=1 Tax=Symbiodinium necroappetens TaxID=1628268 RepID=A0A812J0Z0_9DINO|nr:unnamed protein product [Symbiodinium necroappetens]
MPSLIEQKCGVPLDLALSFLSWRDLVPASAVCTALLTAQSGRPLCCCSTAGPLTALPSTDGALRWLARRAADGFGGGLHFLKISDTACHHTDAGAVAISKVCETLRVLHFHSKVARACEPRLTPRALQILLGRGSSRPALSRVVLHGDAVTDAALELLSGCPQLRSLWLSCSAHVSGASLKKVVSATQLEDLRLDSLLKASGSDVVDAIATKPLRCFLASDAPQFALLSGLEVGRWQAVRRLGILFEAGCPAAMVGCRSLEAEAAMALGALPVLEALALANVHAGDVLLQSFWQGRLQPAARSSLRSLSLEGAHGATLQGVWNLVRALGKDSHHGDMDELQLTASQACPIDDHALRKIVSCGIRFLTLEGASISKAGICRCVGLQALRSKSCPHLDLPPKPRLGPAAGRRFEAGRRSCPSGNKGTKTHGSTSDVVPVFPDVRLLGPDQQLCYWWNKGYKYDDLSWYGLEHLTE